MAAVFPQREPAEEALKSNHMNLDQAMSKCPGQPPLRGPGVGLSFPERACSRG